MYNNIVIQSQNLMKNEKILLKRKKLLVNENRQLLRDQYNIKNNSNYDPRESRQEIMKISAESRAALEKVIRLQEEYVMVEGKCAMLEKERDRVKDALMKVRQFMYEKDLIHGDLELGIELVKSESSVLGKELISVEESIQYQENDNMRLEEELSDLEGKIVQHKEFINQSQNELNISISKGNVLKAKIIAVAIDSINRSIMEDIIEPISFSKIIINIENTELNTICFSPHKNHFVVGGSDKILRLYTSEGEEISQLSGCSQAILSSHFSPDGQFVLAASNDQQIQLWSVGSKSLLHSLTGHQNKIFSSKFTSDSRSVVSGSHDRTIKIWDITKGTCSATKFCMSSCNDVSCSESILASGHQDNNVRIWDIRSLEPIREINNIHKGQVTSVKFSNDTNYILTNSRDNTLKKIDMRTYEVVETYSDTSYKNGLNWTRATFNPLGDKICAGSVNGKLFIWDSERNLQLLDKRHEGTVTCCDWVDSEDGHELIGSCDKKGNVIIWSN